ncbi:MAG: amino acid adenylation domain-containing protein [Bryobacteraceae bacterium]|nr:amino acid adenylation domain-containing protein [Bryobacterales bacterium]MEB2362231.1 amino acid adenylation domain-containing protein [Bryobacterales bacterium]NUM99655.1 amino acid adenylation domain-containing protein [Bryobacteraceae bacterium]
MLTASARSDEIEDIYELSPLQQGILFHTLYDPGSWVYFEQVSFPVHGRLNRNAFRQAWRRVVERHAVLRTSFYWNDLTKPLQVVHRQVETPFEERDWRGKTREEQAVMLDDFLRADRDAGFDLSHPPAFRLALFELTDVSFQCVFSFSHLLMDGWSLQTVFREVTSAYASYSLGEEPQFPPTRPYADYIAWLQEQNSSAAEAFWKRTLADFTFTASTGIERPAIRPGQQRRRYGEHWELFSAPLTAALQAFAVQHRLTLSSLMHGVWALLLGRYSGQDEVMFGSVVSGRPPELAGVESMVGLFINTIPVPARIRRDLSAAQWLEEFHTAQWEFRGHQYSSLVQIQSWSAIPAGVPLFNSLLAFENYPMSVPGEAAHQHSEVRHFQRTNYPLTLAVVPGSELQILFSYDQEHFTDDAIRRMAGHFQTMLEGIVCNAATPVHSLPLLTPEERRGLLSGNNTKTKYPRPECIHRLFEEQAARHPQAIAIDDGEEPLSYGELNRKANRLAWRLISLGAGPEQIVGISTSDPARMVAGILGILKTGAGYLPLDSDDPRERLALMIADAGARLIVTDNGVADALPTNGARLVRLETLWDGAAQPDPGNPPYHSGGESIAYAMYTSGSTGTPKAVAIPHRAISRLLLNTNYVRLTDSDRMAMQSNCSFDAATFEIWGALLHGGCLVPVKKDVTLSPWLLASKIREEGISVMFVTTALFNRLASEMPSLFGPLRYLLVGGEPAEAKYFRSVLEAGPPGCLLNMYGPTESTTFAVGYAAARVDEAAASVPIGRPISNTQVYLLDHNLQLVPVGVTGHLYLGGDGLARGYLNRPDLTAEKFIPDPFSTEAGARLYKTGDLARLLPDGNIEFAGRIDDQIKIRGFRVEPGEIEAVLASHPAVRQPVVIARREERGGTLLVAYVVPQPEAALSAMELRRFLKTRLPEYMVPAAFVVIDKVPLSPNQKVDRAALFHLGEAHPAPLESHVPPRNRMEEQLAVIWADVLGIAKVGINDSFFELGGHSLLATQLISRVREAFEVELPFAAFFESPTVAGLAGLIETGEWRARSTPAAMNEYEQGEL